MTQKPRKIFDMNSGHYIIPVNEADTDNTGFSASEPQQNDDANKQQQAQQPEMNRPVEQSEEIQKINAQVDAENKRYTLLKQSVQNTYNTQNQTAKETLSAAKQAASAAQNGGSYDRVQTNADVIAARKKLLDMDLKFTKDVQRIEVEHAQNIYNIENQRLNVLQKMANESLLGFPPKYAKVLNESNIQSAKIYLNELIGDREENIMENMHDFKHVFCESGMVYGKDKNGYYVLCIDKEDFNKLYEVLQNVGYMKDEIFSVVMPQILDRRGMIQKL